MDLAVIIPYVGEYPHLIYTIQNLLLELQCLPDGTEFEIITIDNANPGRWRRHEADPHNNPAALKILSDDGRRTPWLRRLKYDEKLSHWSAKNYAVQQTDAEFLFFLDAHCDMTPNSLVHMFQYFRQNWEQCNGVINLPLARFFRTERRIYELLFDPDIGLFHYVFKPCNVETIAKVPVMSSCGMLCRREIITDDLEYWPAELGPYGGGENYCNGVLARLGKSINIYPDQPIYHWALPGHWVRDYRPTYPQYARNIMIATYLIAGDEWLERLVRNRERLPEDHGVRCCDAKSIADILSEIKKSETLKARRERLESKFVLTLEEWAQQWEI